MKTLFYSFLFSLLLISCGNNSKSIYNIEDFGAKGDSLTLNTQYIQKAIDKAFAAGGRFIPIHYQKQLL